MDRSILNAEGRLICVHVGDKKNLETLKVEHLLDEALSQKALESCLVETGFTFWNNVEIKQVQPVEDVIKKHSLHSPIPIFSAFPVQKDQFIRHHHPLRTRDKKSDLSSLWTLGERVSSKTICQIGLNCLSACLQGFRNIRRRF